MNYKNVTVMITGAAGGIGRELVNTYHKLNASVIAIDIDPVILKEMKIKYTERFDARIIDLRDPKQIMSFFSELKASNRSVEILINCAGVSTFTEFTSTSVDEWNQILSINLRAPFLMSQQFSKHLLESSANYGRIVNIASTRAFMSESGSEAYAASKGGIISLTHAMAISLADSPITVNSISPGWIEFTDYEGLNDAEHLQHPSKRVGTPKDVAKACLYITDSENDFLNGENIILDGGMTKKMIYI